jgi:hypothetical protein
MKADPLTYIASKMGVWTKEDGELELGPPIDRRDGTDKNNNVISDVYKYSIPYSGFGIIELNIYRNTKKVGAAYFYYRTTVSWSQVQQTVRKNYKKQKLGKGVAGAAYIYQFGPRQYYVLVDSAENVRNVGVW